MTAEPHHFSVSTVLRNGSFFCRLLAFEINWALAPAKFFVFSLNALIKVVKSQNKEISVLATDKKAWLNYTEVRIHLSFCFPTWVFILSSAAISFFFLYLNRIEKTPCGRSMENFYQESGRAGRDDQPARCILQFRYNILFFVNKWKNVRLLRLYL